MATGNDIHVPVTVRNSKLIPVCWRGSKEKSTSKLEEWGVKVFGICLFPYPYLENWFVFFKGKKGILFKTEISKNF